MKEQLSYPQFGGIESRQLLIRELINAFALVENLATLSEFTQDLPEIIEKFRATLTA